MQHLDEGTIHAWLEGALPADEAARVELHVASCETCSEAVAEARGLIAASSRILTALDDVPRVGAQGAQGDRGDRGWFLVRSRIAAVVALVVAGGALALAVRRDSVPTVALQTTADSGSEVALVATELAAPQTVVAPNVEGSARVRGDAAAGRGGIGSVTGNTPARSTARERDLMSDAADSVPPTLAQLDVSAAAAPPPAPPARTDDTARWSSAVAAAARLTPDTTQAEGRSSVTEKRAGALGARSSVAEAPARFAEPRAAQPAMRVVVEPNAPRPLTEERMVEDGRVVVRRVYRVEETLVTLDERAPPEREQREHLEVLEQRLRRVEPQAAEEAPRVDSTTTPVSTIRWVDSRGAEFTLSGPVPREQLERFRRLMGY